MAPKLTFGNRLPEDIALYILEFLPPQDLLTWTQIGNKRVLERLLNNDSIWKECLRNVTEKWPHPPPPPPEDMSAYEYTVLLFGKECSVCKTKPRFLHRFWELRLVTCSPCARLESNLCVSRVANDDDLVPWICVPVTGHCHKTTRAHYDRVVNRLKELEGNEPARSQFIASCRERTEAMHNLAGQLRAWQKECSATRQAIEEAKSRIKDERQRQVIERLGHMNLGTEANLFYKDIRSHRILWPNRPLSNKDDKLMNDLCAMLTTLREDHDKKKRLELLTKTITWASAYKLDVVTAPSASVDADLQYLSELFPLMREPLQLDNMTSEKMAEAAFHNLCNPNSNSIITWFYSGRLQLACDVILSATRRSPSVYWTHDRMKQFLELAVNVFVRDDVRVNNDVPAVHYPFILYPDWREHPFVFDAYTSANLATLVRSCGMDPQTTSWTTMHNLNARFVCRTCITRGASISTTTTVFDWCSAVRHIIKHARGSNRDQPEELNCVRLSPAIQAELPVSATPCTLVWYRCLKCWAHDVAFDTDRGIRGHCMAHGVAWGSIRKGVDYTTLKFPPPSKIGRLLGDSSEVRIAGMHLLKDVAALTRGKEVELTGAGPINLERIFGTAGLKQMDLFAQSIPSSSIESGHVINSIAIS